MEQEHNAADKKIRIQKGVDGWSFITLFTGVAFLPLFFLPILGLSLDITKSAFFFTLTIVSFLLWLIARMKTGRFVFPKSTLLAAAMVLPAVFLISALFSEVSTISLWGIEYELGTFFSILVLALVVFLSSIFFQTKERVPVLYGWFIGASFVAFLFAVVGLLFSAGVLPAFIAPYIPANIIGKWNDLAAFFGFTGVLSLVMLELAAPHKKLKRLLMVSLMLSLFVLALVNFSLLWVLVGAFALIVFVYSISFGQKNTDKEITERKIPLVPFTVLILAVLFVLASTPVNSFVQNVLHLNIPQEVVRPSWYATASVAKDTLLHNPVFGMGPNRFLAAWTTYKPAGINATDAWGVDFSYGIGVVPTFAVTLGIVGVLVWIAFLVLFLYAGFRAIFKMNVDKTAHYLLASSFLGAAYLWVVAIFYVPNITLFALAFVMTGVFIAMMVVSRVAENYDFSFLEDPRIGFTSVLAIILLIVSSVVGGYMVTEKFLSLVSYQRGVVLGARGDVQGARTAFEYAKKLRESDLYYRALSEVEINSLNVILKQQGVSQETIKAQFQVASRDAIDNALRATQFDPSNYLNWVFLARAYETLIPFGAAADFHDSAKKSFEEAIVHNHANPALYLELAQLEIANKNIDGAKEYIAKALALKNDYVDAIFLLAQVQADGGDLKNAIISAEAASLVSPDNIGVFFQLGYLRFKSGDYPGAIAALERAVELNSSYSNAKYFLGLSYSRVGRSADAIQQFEDIKAMNPGNQEVQTILNNLRTGGDPLSGVSSSVPTLKPAEKPAHTSTKSKAR